MIAYGTHEVESYLVKNEIIDKNDIPRVWEYISQNLH